MARSDLHATALFVQLERCTLILPLGCNTSHSTLWVSCLNKIQIKYYFAYQQSDMTGHITNCITVYMQIRVRSLQLGG